MYIVAIVGFVSEKPSQAFYSWCKGVLQGSVGGGAKNTESEMEVEEAPRKKRKTDQ